MEKREATQLLNNIDNLILEVIKFNASRRNFLKSSAVIMTAPILHNTIKKAEKITSQAATHTSGPIEKVADHIERKLNSPIDRRNFLGRSAEIAAGSTILGRVLNKVKSKSNELSTS